MRSKGLFSCIVFAFLGISLTHPLASKAQPVPAYQVIFDDFDYDATGFPDSSAQRALFAPNNWFDRDGSSDFVDQAWYYYRWRWQETGRVIHPSAAIQLNSASPQSLILSATEGYTRNYRTPTEVPLQIQSGFIHPTGSWAINARFSDLESLRYFTEAFWLISPISTSRDFQESSQWSELNFEWQNWFAVKIQTDSLGTYAGVENNTWAPGNLWVKRNNYNGAVFPTGNLPSPDTRTYMANGVQMFDFSAGAAFPTGETAGGIPMRNPRKDASASFSCVRVENASTVDIDDAVTCMQYIAAARASNAWVQLLIQYDSQDARFSLQVPVNDTGYVLMQSQIAVNKRSLPLLVNLGIHTPNNQISLNKGENPAFEIDWFYFSPNTALDIEDILLDVQGFRSRAWGKVNLDREKLSHPDILPWQIKEINPPQKDEPAWFVLPSIRGTNGIQIQWNYRVRHNENDFFSEWSGWVNGGFHFLIEPPPLEVEMDIRIKDHHATDHGERARWANTSCIRYNYASGESSVCTGGAQENFRFSLDQIPRDVLIDQVYPNPVTTRATIRFGLPKAAAVRITVFDLLGRELGEVFNQEMPSGYHEITWAPDNLPAGRYFINLRSGLETRTLPVIVVH